MKVVIPGGSGQVGTLLAREYHARGYEVIALSRKPTETPWRTVEWHPHMIGRWAETLEGADVVINLAGRSVNCRYTAENREEIMQSSVISTRIVGEAIAGARRPPRLWLQAGTATIYSHRFDAANDDVSGVIGGEEVDAPEDWRFSTDVAKAWEAAVNGAETPNTRKVILRSAITLSPDRGGIFDILLRLVRFGLGGQAGDGLQYVSWIHERDFIRAIDWLIEHQELEGAVNLASSNPLPNRDFMSELRRAWGIPVGMPAVQWMLEAGAVFMGTETELILKSRRVVPARLLESGFAFEFPDWRLAAEDLCRRWRIQSGSTDVTRDDEVVQTTSPERYVR